MNVFFQLVRRGEGGKNGCERDWGVDCWIGEWIVGLVLGRGGCVKVIMLIVSVL